MPKLNWKPGTMLYPLPAVLVSCGDKENSNLLTVAWAGIMCSNPPMLHISVRPIRYSYNIIKEKGEFTVNLTTWSMAEATDLCGVISGSDTDKWKASGLHAIPGVMVSCPMVEESPISLECKVKQILDLGSHTSFVAEIVNVVADDKYIDSDGHFDLDKAGLLSYSHGHYFAQGRPLGHFGFSVRKKKRRSPKK